VNCKQELCIELWSVINFHCEIEPANLLQYCFSLCGVNIKPSRFKILVLTLWCQHKTIAFQNIGSHFVVST
jgi:hypothetical protein